MIALRVLLWWSAVSFGVTLAWVALVHVGAWVQRRQIRALAAKLGVPFA